MLFYTLHVCPGSSCFMGPLSRDHVLYLHEGTRTVLSGRTFYSDGNGLYLRWPGLLATCG